MGCVQGEQSMSTITPIDAVRCGMGFDQAGRWHRAEPRLVSTNSRKYGDENPLAPMQGLIWGVLGGLALWAGLIAAGCAVLTFLS